MESLAEQKNRKREKEPTARFGIGYRLSMERFEFAA
jgi:hypothetical protein